MELLVTLPGRLLALDPTTGQDRWTAEGLGPLVFLSPMVSAESVVAVSGYFGPAMAVRRDRSPDDSSAERLWYHEQKAAQQVESGTIVDGQLYTMNREGVVWCMEVASGLILWKHRLSPKGQCSSIRSQAGHLYVTDQAGTTFVLEPDPTECRVVSENQLNELTRAPLAFWQGQVFARTYGHLFCLEAADRSGK
jgi:outer membrane protein assembly factor BamB